MSGAAPPSSISGLIGWWDSSTLGGAHGSTVNPWNTVSSTGPNLDETAGTAPTLDTSVTLNGIQSVRCAAGRTLRDTTAGTLSGFTNGLAGATLYVVAKLDDASTTNRRAFTVATGAAGAGASRFVLYTATGVPNFAARRVDGVGAANIASAGGSIGTGAAHCIAGTIDYATTTQELYVDGTLQASSTSALSSGVTTTDSTGVAVGSHPGNTAEGWPGPVWVALLWNRKLTTNERLAVDAWIADTYGITMSTYTTVSAAETLAHADALGSMVAAVTAAETLAGADTIGGQARAADDTLAGADAVAALAAAVSAAEALNLADLAAGQSRTAADALALSDSVGALLAAVAGAETLGLADAVSALLAQISAAETLTHTEGTSVSTGGGTASVSDGDTLTHTDAASGMTRSAAEVLALVDSAAGQARSADEALAHVDAVLAQARAAVESLTLLDAAGNQSRAAAEALSLLDLVAAVVDAATRAFGRSSTALTTGSTSSTSAVAAAATASTARLGGSSATSTTGGDDS